MTGEYTLKVRSNMVRYSLIIRRKYTIINGDTGTGKTRLFNLILSSKTHKQIKVICNATIDLVREKDDLEEHIERNAKKGVTKVIYLIDEDVCDELYADEMGKYFSRVTAKAEGYFVLITRKQFTSIPYSVSEIYNLTERLDSIKKYEIEAVNTYEWVNYSPIKSDSFITEDAKVGYIFFKGNLKDTKVITADGNSNIKNVLKDELRHNDVKTVCVFADGAAFGCYIKKLLETIEEETRGSDRKVRLLIFESFEYVILMSELFSLDKDKLLRTFDYADSKNYLSWERYYTDLLRKVSEGEYNKSSKQLPMFLRDKRNVRKIFDFIKEVTLEC